MAVIWGLDLKEIQWGKFKNSYMWNNHYHLRRTKFIIYQLAMIFYYIDEQKSVERYSSTLGPEISVRNNDIVGAFSYNIFVGVFVATIFGAAFFFDLFWPERSESKAVRIAWKVCAVLACCFALSSAILLTVVLSTHRATLTGDATNVKLLLDPPLSYKSNGEAIASVVLIWLGWLFTGASAGLMFSSINHIQRFGAKSSHLRNEEKTQAPINDETRGNVPGEARV